jgi:hypothetical protein
MGHFHTFYMAMLNNQRVIPVFFLDGFSSLRLCPLLGQASGQSDVPLDFVPGEASLEVWRGRGWAQKGNPIGK